MQEEDIQIDLPMQSLYFYTTYFPYHKKMVTMINMQESSIPFFAIDVDQFSKSCKRFMIDSIPTLLFLKSGKEIKRLGGPISTLLFKSALADIYNLNPINGVSNAK